MGPFGNQLNDVAISRMLFRFANQGRTDRGITNHAGLATNFDFRSVGQVTGSTVANANTLNWFIDVDTGGRIYFINWLPGRPASSANFTFSNIFNASSGNTRGGMAHVCVGINQEFNNPGVTDVNHIVTFSQEQINRSPTSATDSTNVRGVFQQTGAWMCLHFQPIRQAEYYLVLQVHLYLNYRMLTSLTGIQRLILTH